MTKESFVEFLSQHEGREALVKHFFKLTENHMDVLMSAFQHDGWATEGCGWLWSTNSYTLKTCQSLAKKGFLKEASYKKKNGVMEQHYSFTPFFPLTSLSKAEIKESFAQVAKTP